MCTPTSTIPTASLLLVIRISGMLSLQEPSSGGASRYLEGLAIFSNMIYYKSDFREIAPKMPSFTSKIPALVAQW